MPDEPAYVRLFGGRYRVDRFWGEQNLAQALGRVSTIAVASDGAVLVAQRSGAPVIVINPDASLRCAWDTQLASDPHGINVDGADRVLLVDRDAHQVIVADMSGQVLLTLGERHQPRFQAPFNHPTSAAVAGDGDIYVADGYGNAAVHHFSPQGEHLASWGEPGTGPGQFSTPHSIWVDTQNRVLVADRENHRVQVFDRDGTYIDSWYGFHNPMDLCEDIDGNIYISDQIPRLSQVDGNGRLLGRCRPVWNVPHGVACAAQGEIYLTEMNPNSLTRLVPVSD